MATPNTNPEILAALEVVRQGQDDLNDPELAHAASAVEQDASLADRLASIQSTDERLAAAFHNVEVPSELEQRVLYFLASESTGDNVDEEARSDVHPVVQGSVPGLATRIATSRFTWSSVAIAASVMVAFFLWPRSAATDSTPPEHLLEQAIAFFQTDTNGQGVSVAEKSPPSGYEPSADVRHIDTSDWREIEDFLGYRTVAYDLSGPRGEQATLYVSQHPVEQLEMVTLPSAKPWLATGGVSATCWKVDGRLFVLVVEGGREQYDEFVKQPGSTVAPYWPTPAWSAQAA